MHSSLSGEREGARNDELKERGNRTDRKSRPGASIMETNREREGQNEGWGGGLQHVKERSNIEKRAGGEREEQIR